MDRLEAMSIVLQTVEKGSLTAAAKAFNMPLPTLSRKLSDLEAYLGTKLLQRSTRKLALTDAGQSYVASIKRIMEEIEEVERAASSEYTTPRGELVLTAPLLFGQMYILPIVTDFLAAYPEINVRLLLSDRNLHLYDDHVDMAVRLGDLPDSSMIATRVGTMDTVVCAAPDLLAAHGVPKHPKDLQRLPCVIFTGPSSASWSFRNPANKREFGVDIVPRLSVTAAESAVQAAVRRTGLTRVYRYHCADELRSGRLVQVLQEFDVEPIPVHLVHAARGQLPLKMRVFLDFAASQLRSALSKLG
ncbi:LysR family transcriptional regulator [Bradyrhizobium sp. CCBAU 21362]|uniref:LysR family transcriptional regulator n=1 Tax=Bradyrhizobium sp. CCBAU 21362 TaxID=1325082 RepID=UPI002305F88A|nr:LysR family transcriptional regulator [Bradyrhizobium sp. CCBAU 21362]MDA9540809.1 LysR family transcriptional regulator [Bradyrhizobium sp. CCBAU 21362]